MDDYQIVESLLFGKAAKAKLMFAFYDQNESFLTGNSDFLQATGYSLEFLQKSTLSSLLIKDGQQNQCKLEDLAVDSFIDIKLACNGDKGIPVRITYEKILIKGQYTTAYLVVDTEYFQWLRSELSIRYLELQASYEEIEAVNQELEFYQNRLLANNKTLQEKQDYLELSLWSANIGLWEWNIDDGKLYLDEKCVDIIGYDPRKGKGYITNEQWERSLHKLDRERVLAILDAHIRGDVPYYVAEYRSQPIKNKWLWLLAKGRIINREDGNSRLKMLGTLQDISDLRQEERVKTAILETMDEQVVYLDNDYNIKWINAAAKAAALNNEKIAGEKCYWVFSDSEQVCEQCAVKRAITGKTVCAMDLKREGNKYLHSVCYPIIDENSAVNGVVMVSRDITASYLQQKALKASYDKYQSLFNQSPIGLLQISKSGRIININEHMVDLFKLKDKSQLLNVDLFNIQTYLSPETINDLHSVLETGRPLRNETLIKDKRGNELWVAYKADIIPEEDNNFELIVACEDITERKKRELEIEYLTYHDALTGAYNRVYFEKMLREAPQHFKLPLTIVMGDVNGLKLINDDLGPAAGDQLLINVAHLIEEFCRPGDIIARWGGDEFAILLPETDSPAAEEICHKIIDNCRSRNTSQHCLSLGHATMNSFDTSGFDIIQQAENNMFTAKMLDSHSMRSSILASLETTLHERTHETREHASRMQDIAVMFAQSLDLEQNNIDKLVLLAKLHDIGKIAVPNHILDKPGPLDKDEWEIIKKHPEIGFRIVQASSELGAIGEAILSHHERWDGKGYPRGLKGEKIPLLARIIAIVDAYDVMTHSRAYKEAISSEEAINEIKINAGSQFDPLLAATFIATVEKQQ